MGKTPCVVMRGGTSKALFFHYKDMPSNQADWTPFLLDAMGSPDPKQIDGMGGANSLTSKVAIIKKSEREGTDVDYTFAQVSLADSVVDFKGNCGNISSAVAPFAVDEGLVDAVGQKVKVRIFNTNTNKLIVSEIEVENGKAKFKGDCQIPGVPGSGSPIYMSFYEPQGSVTGQVLPTGNAMDHVEVSIGKIAVSIVDAANPLVFIKAEDVGLKGTELPKDFTEEQLSLLEEVRSAAAELCGFAIKAEATKKSPAVPKTTLISSPRDFTDSKGTNQCAQDMDLVIRMMSMQKPHNTLALTGAVCTTVAAYTKGTLVSGIVENKSGGLRLGHPSGIMSTAVGMEAGEIRYVTGVRTARRLMDGHVYTKNNY